MKRRLVGLVLSLAFVVSFAMPGVARANVNDFTVTNFSADYYLNNADQQGQMRVVENISVNFTDNNHGILRALPESYKGHPLHLHIQNVSSNSGAPAQFTTYGSNGNLVLKIGDPNRTVTGSQEYTISYTEQNVISFYGNHDELYWDINGDQWDQPFTAVHATVHLPVGLKQTSQQPECFVGSYGSTSRACSISTAGNSIVANATNLDAQSTLTMVAGFQKGYFQPMTLRDYLVDYGVQALEFLAPFVLLGGGGFVWWLKRGRDAKGRGVIIPEYDAPDGLKPIEVGSIIDFRVDDRDLTATIIDLAIRKYIRIVESEISKFVVMKKKSFELHLLNKDWSALNQWELQIMTGLFHDDGSTEVIDLAAMATKLHTVATDIKKSVASSLTDRGYYVSSPSKYLTVPLATLVISGWIGFYIFVHVLSGWFTVGTGAGFVILALCYHFMPARTAKGVAAKEHILGLKMYLEVAEKNRIAKLQSPDAPYAEKSAEPKHTVELFEKLLPYAIVLKVEDKWAQKFENIYAKPPDWYVGNYAAFNAGYLVGSLSSGFAPAVNSSFSAPHSSGGSGFGGGFAGGGGGGGGGGGW